MYVHRLPTRSKRLEFFYLETKDIFVSRDVQFLENVFPFTETSGTELHSNFTHEDHGYVEWDFTPTTENPPTLNSSGCNDIRRSTDTTHQPSVGEHEHQACEQQPGSLSSQQPLVDKQHQATLRLHQVPEAEHLVSTPSLFNGQPVVEHQTTSVNDTQFLDRSKRNR